MAQPLLCADNLASALQYPDQVSLFDQSGTTGPVGFETWRVADGRRSAFDFWQPGTTNVDAFLTVTCGRVRGANYLALDRGHNLAGKTINLFGSQDNFATQTTVLTVTVPTAGGQIAGVVSGGIVQAGGATTEEGAFLITFPTAGYTYWRFDVPAMGAGLQPNVVGLWLGMSYQPTALYRPFTRHTTEFRAQETVSPIGWRGRGPRAFNRATTLNLRMDTQFEYADQARFTCEELLGAGRPTWIVEDQSRPQEAALVLRVLGTQGFAEPQNWANPVGSFTVIEHEEVPV
jgi:hypothetical protein